jgi:hypothetical protein
VHNTVGTSPLNTEDSPFRLEPSTSPTEATDSSVTEKDAELCRVKFEEKSSVLHFAPESETYQGNQKDTEIKKSQNIFCHRPGCPNPFSYDVRVPDKIFCSVSCYNALRLARKRLLHWYRLTGCVFALAQYIRLGGHYHLPP